MAKRIADTKRFKELSDYSRSMHSSRDLDFGIQWIALNDAPGDIDALEPDAVAGYISTTLLADLFELDPLIVARAIVKYRKAQS